MTFNKGHHNTLIINVFVVEGIQHKVNNDQTISGLKLLSCIEKAI